MTNIGVEHSLTDIQDALTQQGYNVAQLRNVEDAGGIDFDFCVVTGLDTNVLGIPQMKSNAAIIEANGMTANQVVAEIKNRLNQ